MGNAVQSNSIAVSWENAFGVPRVVTGLILAVVSVYVFSGGMERIAKVTERLVPFMVLVYIVGSLAVIFMNMEMVPSAFHDIIKGAFSMNMRYFSFYSKDTDVIRVTGYLVKLSEVEEYRKGKAVLDTTTNFGSGAKDGLKIMQRKVRGFDYA